MPKGKILSLAAILPLGLSLVAAPVANAATPVPESFTFNGAGWGHGVGMSQYGAYGMALDGFNAEQILEHYYNPAQVGNSTLNASKDALVQLIGGQNSTTITPSNGQLRVKFDGKTINSSSGVRFDVSGSSVKVTANGKSYTTSGANGVSLEWQNTRYWTSGNSDTTVSVPLANGGYSAGTYRHGKITVKLLNKKLNVVNSVRMNDEYLYGLAEVPSSWPSATLQAQAIAGRTYALRNMSSVKVACGCNVYDEVASQKFTGWGKENEANGVIGKKWVAAVNATQSKKNGIPVSAKVVTHKGALIDAVYSSSTGGKTRSAKDVWGYDHAYLQSRDDHWALDADTKNPNRAWSGTISQSKAAQGYGLSDVKKINVKRSGDDTILSSTAVSSDGKASTLTGYKTRVLFGAKSTWVFGITAKGESLPATDSYPVANTTANVKYTTTSNLNMRSGPTTSHGVTKVLAKGSEVVTTGKKSGTWLQIKSGSTTGWVSSAYLAKVAATAPKPTTPTPAPAPKPVKPAVTVKYNATANVHLRSGAGTSNKSLGVLKNGTSVTGTGKTSSGWVQVKFGSKTGWVSGTYLKKASTATPKPSTPAKPAPKPTTPTVKATAYTSTTNVNFRTGASTKYQSLGVLKKGTKVTATGKKSAGWIQVKSGSKTGWVSGTYLKASTTSSPVAKAPVKKATKKTTANLNMRSGAGTGHKILTTIPKNKSVTLTGKTSGSWKQVTYGSKTGWVSGSYLK